MSLTDAKLRALKPKVTSYKVSDAEGLHVLVPVNGSKLWRWAYRFGGKQKVLALGHYQTSLCWTPGVRAMMRGAFWVRGPTHLRHGS
jgi:hypothetical protein